MSPEALAELHARSFTTPRPWSANEFRELLAHETCTLITEPAGFALIRVIAGEAELLSIAVEPAMRRTGLGHRLLQEALNRAESLSADRIFLEVSAENQAATGLYRKAGFAQEGRRRAYYRHPDGARSDALVMARALRPSQGSTRSTIPESG